MSLDDALVLVQRSGTAHRSKGSDIGDRMVDGDIVLVQRGTDRFKATYDGSGTWSNIRDTDLLLAWDGSNNRRVTGANFKSLFKEPIPPLGEWNWIGNNSNSELYKMCDNGNQRHAFFKYDWHVLYFDHIDRNGQTGMHTKFEQSINNGDEIWFKVNNQPAMKHLEEPFFLYTVYYCSFSLNQYGPELPTEHGVLRWYNTNPDAD